MLVHIYVCMYEYMFIRRKCMYAEMYVCIYMYAYMYVCLSVCNTGGKDKVQKDKDVQLALSLDVYASDVKSGALKKGFNFMPKPETKATTTSTSVDPTLPKVIAYTHAYIHTEHN